MAGDLPPDAVFTGGWFGNDGQSSPDEQPYIDGWFGGPLTDQDCKDILNWLITQLISKKPIYINSPEGDLQELRLVWPVL